MGKEYSNKMTILSRKSHLGMVIKTILILICMAACGNGARIKRAVMMKMDMMNLKCEDSSITESNLTSSVVLTATVKSCDLTRKTSYSCEVQVWRIMKGKDLADNLTKVIKQGTATYVTYQKLATIYGLGNPQFCDSETKVDNTRIFFLNRINDRLVLSSSILRITLQNLQNTQKVIEGTNIEEPEKKPVDPCMDVLCGFKATCQVTADNQPTCVCPDFECGKSNVFAPVCGSDGVTYASECRLLASQCWKQSRIRVASRKACAPVTEDDPCKQVDCGNSASCVVSDLDGIKAARCECPTCENIPTRPVCGSDQTSHRTECDLRRTACLSGQDILLVRRSACNPCEMYNEETSSFDLSCIGPCSLDSNNDARCCGSIECADDEMDSVVCGNDGRTYQSICAMKKQACRTAKSIEKIADGACVQKSMTNIRGSVSIAADEKCPGGCDPMNTEFIEFRNNFERLVNEELVTKNSGAEDEKVLSDFKINEVRIGSSVLVYSAHMSSSNDPITEDHIPGSESLWAFLRLHDPASGAVVHVAASLDVNFVDYRDPLDDFYSEDVCENVQCDFGSVCSITVDGAGNSKPECKCDGNGNPDKLPVTHACKRADNGRIYLNRAAVHTAECSMHHYFTFKDLCRDPPSNPCDSHECTIAGTSCVVTNEVASCECKTCEEVYQPVCGSNDQTYKSECELQRYNCLNGLNVVIKSRETCGSPCDTVDCGLKQCIETPQGSAVCTCPESCLEVKSPVCGSDGMDYDNECLLTVEACKSQMEITVSHQGTCSSVPKSDTKPMEGDDEFEGSGEANECGCRYEATCETTIDDEDAGCVCNFDCADEPASKVCGSDGRTYESDCARRKVQCEAQAYIALHHTGACVGCSDSIYGCCEDGVTYSRGPLAAGCPENCGCNLDGSFDLTCHPVTRQCSCKPGISGLTCNRCEPGFWNFQAVVTNNAKGCMSCQCHPEGSVRDDCDQMTGHCVCKPGVMGPKCSKCIDTGDWPTKVGCAKPKPDVMSCDELNCRSNQNCVESEDGKFSCECPSVTTCDNGKQMLVCATNGMTYSSECLMRVITCRSGIDVQVQTEGTCKDFVKANEKLKEDQEKEEEKEEPLEEEDMIVPDLVDVPDSSTAAPTPTTSTTTTTTMAETTAKSMEKSTDTTTIIMEASSTMTEEEMSGDGDDMMTTTTSSFPVDDEDGDDLEEETGSGEVDMVEPKEIVSSSSDKSCGLMGDAKFNNVDGMDSSVLAQNPEIASEYESEMEDQLLAILKSIPGLPNQVEAIKVQELNMNDGGVNIKFHITLTPDSTLACNSDAVKTTLNSMPKGNWGEIVISDADDEPGATDKTVYYESSTWPTLPQFGGASYAEFKELQSTNIAVTMEVDFRTFDADGVILYSGQTKQPAKDFISLSVKNGRVEFRFDTGSGPLVLRSERRVDDGLFHKTIIRRNRKYGMLKIDDDAEVTDSAPGSTHGVDLDSHLYVGGFPNALAESISTDVDVTKGLTGCISEIYVVPYKKNLNFSLFDTIPRDFHRLAECRESPCNPNPCQNSANCFITKQQEKFTYKCLCGKNYKGEHCEMLSMDVGACSSSPCHASATCLSDPATPGNYTCACPPSRKGVNCEIFEEDDSLPFSPLYMPGFAGDSYIEHESLSSIAKHKLDVSIVFYSVQPDGLLFYNGQKKSGKGEFVSLNLRNGYVEFIYDLGDGPAILRSPSMVSMYEWHEVRASRNGRSGSLLVDDTEVIVGESPVKSTQLNVEQSLYIGGVPDFSRVAPAASITTGLNGALQKVVINDQVYDHLMDEALSSYNVRAFTGHVCYRKPCKNDGMCLPNMGQFTCKCPIGYSGTTCEIVNYDETMLQDQSHDTLRFNGKTSIRYLNLIRISDLSVDDDYFAIELKTTMENGLILHVGHSTSEGDYLALGINDGRLHLRFDLGSGAAFIESDRINDGQWKLIKISRERHEAEMQINDEPPLHLSAPPIARTLNSNGILWLGGSDDLPKNKRGFPKSFSNNYQGCIGSLKVGKAFVHLREDSLDAVWLPTCTTRRK